MMLQNVQHWMCFVRIQYFLYRNYGTLLDVQLYALHIGIKLQYGTSAKFGFSLTNRL